MNGTKHKNYEILNLIGYGLAKFDKKFVKRFGFNNKSSFFEFIVNSGIAETIGTVKNRQDLFDPFFDNNRKGWWQKGDAYIHRKILIDNFYGELSVEEYANVILLYIKDKYKLNNIKVERISPIFKSKFKQLQTTGLEAEEFFINNYRNIEKFTNGKIDDARILGDGYDFQITVDKDYYLAEIKGIRTNYGGIRLTENEYKKAKEFKNYYTLVIVTNLNNKPKLNVCFNPISSFEFNKTILSSKQINYHIVAQKWE